MELSVLASNLEPYILEIIQNSAFAGSGNSSNPNGSGLGSAPSPHGLFSEHHNGILDRSQAPWVSSDISSAITSHVGQSDPHPNYVHTTIAKSVSAQHTFTGMQTFSGTPYAITSTNNDAKFHFGRTAIGESYDGYASFMNRAVVGNINNYALLQSSSGATFLNAIAGGTVYHRIGNVDVLNITSSEIKVHGSSAARLGSDNYASKTTGWNMTYAGQLDTRYIFANEMHVEAFIADIEMALNGGQIVTKSTTTLSFDMTVPNYGLSTFMVVDAFPGFPNAFVFQTGDTIGIKITTRTDGNASTPGSLVSSWVFGTVSGPVIDAPNKRQGWTFTRLGSNLINGFAAGGTAFAGSVIGTGAIVLDFGVSGNGYWETNAVDGVNVTGGQLGSNAPYAQAVTWNLHPVYDRTVRTRTGNLTGVGFSGQWGMYARGADNNQYIACLLYTSPSPRD
jgi:hypothetical protein